MLNKRTREHTCNMYIYLYILGDTITMPDISATCRSMTDLQKVEMIKNIPYVDER